MTLQTFIFAFAVTTASSIASLSAFANDSTIINGVTWTAVPDWGQHDDLTIGNTHGTIAISPTGRVHINTDADHGTLVHDPGGNLYGHIAERFPGLHDMQLRIEHGTPYLYGAHLRGKQVVKLRLDGTHVWTLGVPMESGKYDDNPDAYNPTAVAVADDGRIYVADGYGRNWVHIFGPDLKYRKTFGGPGSDAGQFQTCHGMAIDASGSEPLLVICDRENRRLQRFTLDGAHVDTPVTGLRRPCGVAFWTSPSGEQLIAIAELEGRITLLDGNYKRLGVLGNNPDKSHWANNGVPKEAWKTGVTTAPHGLCFDADGNLYVQDWNGHGRVHKFVRSQD
jgi:DNA-binding beta-propeller fold protein YncE